jgi:hypothetical protein
MKRLLEESDTQRQPPESEDEEPVGLKAIAHRPIAFTRSGSADDLRGIVLSTDAPPSSDLMATWIIKFGNKVTQVQALEGSKVQEICDRAAVELGIGIKKWKTTIDRRGLRIHVTCTSSEPIVVKASIHFGNQEWAGNVNKTFTDDQLVQEAQAQLGLEETWQVRAAVSILGVRTIEAERIEVEIERPPLPRDSEVVFDYHGTRRTVVLKAGATAWDQAQAAQKAFGETLMCSPIEETGDNYTIQVYKPTVYPVIFVKGEDRIRSWVDNTKLKVAQEEARRLFGGRPTLELLSEPGLVYQVRTAPTRSQKPKGKPKSNTRQMTGAGIKPVVPPSLSHRRATPRPDISQRSTDGRDMDYTGADKATGYRGVNIHVYLPQKKQTIKGVALARDASRVQIAELMARQLRVDPLQPDFIELAPDNWFETRELSARFRYGRPDLATLDRIMPDQFRERMDLTKPMFIETDWACSGNPGPGGWGFIVAQGAMKVEAYGAEGVTSNSEMELNAIDEAF